MKYRDKFLGHMKTVLIHKFWVFYFSCIAGIPLQGLIHDMSKFHPTEFFESVKYFQGNRSPIDACKEVNEYSMAWLHHKGRNPNHYEFWQDNFDKGGHPLRIPYKYAIEMICDYLAAGKAYMKEDFTYQAELEWWRGKTKNPIAMHDDTFMFVNAMMVRMARENSCKCLKKKYSYPIYVVKNSRVR